ncbi:hypothetical protein AUJ77_02100 [Candidatus Nomurabacteria bacterium CG1_02_43_90]|uniref:Endolytic murein transglycosylase n=1 Tax=Candidatus Nomurabacteria bacterium CG1_02_43_90 TaxID=1805281 RepID=A0A1J4V0B1_9BACT|nr:MAG: hypothetical protein AUJ77_02100 [Candidatus Nomurabacteria bacterium CG1_02_43_90]
MNETQVEGTNKEDELSSEEIKRKTTGEEISLFIESIRFGKQRSKVLLFFVLLIVFFSATISFFLMPPLDFPLDKTIVIKNGFSLGQVSFLLEDQHLIRSRLLFEFCAMVVGKDKELRAGTYLLETPVGACGLALRITAGNLGVPVVKATIPEGLSNRKIAGILSAKLPQFDATFFMNDTKSQEGYLFPDTYFFSREATAQEVEAMMRANFDKKIATIKPLIDASNHSLKDIIIMASILEKEAVNDTDREIVAGILWKRIEIGMPLQIDASFLYLLGKKSSELTLEDLQMDSLYNTYRNRGLPAGPIGNPGLSALHAALSSRESPYLYYLSDNNGVMHYSKNFKEHKANKMKYLR